MMGALWGFIVFVIIFNQCISGTMLSFSLPNECMLVSLSREEEDSENNYTDDFFWLHERGVDIVIIASFCHLLRKLYLGINDVEQEYSWKTGVFSFLIIQVILLSSCSNNIYPTKIVEYNQINNNPYKEWRRDRPCEARQPALRCKVLNPAAFCAER